MHGLQGMTVEVAGLKWGGYWRTTTNLLYVAMLDTKLDINNAAECRNEYVLYSGKLSREKFCNYWVLWLFAKVFSVKFGGMAFIGGGSEQSTKVFSTKMYFPLVCESLLLRKFPAIHLVWKWVIPVAGKWTSHFYHSEGSFVYSKCQPWMHMCRCEKLPKC